MVQIITAVIIPIIVGLIQIQAKQHGAKSLTILYMANMILLGSWIYSWTINLAISTLSITAYLLSVQNKEMKQEGNQIGSKKKTKKIN